MSLFSNCNHLTSDFFVAWLNNDTINHYINAFITNTSTLQINDVRVLPIIFIDKVSSNEIKLLISDLVSHKTDLSLKAITMSENRIQKFVDDVIV